MEGSAELEAFANDSAFLEGDNRGDDFDAGFRARADANQFLESAIIFRAAIGIAGAVFGDCADVDGVSADDFGPTDGHGKKMGVAKGHVGDGNFGGAHGVMIFGDGNVSVGKRGTADGTKMIELDDQTVFYIVKIGDEFESL